MRERPNILWLCADQQRWDTIHALGNAAIRTPHLDRLCGEGVAFTRAYCQSPVCTPSRASFLTGCYPSATGANRNGGAYFPTTRGVRLITERLATEAGYACGLVGKLHLASPIPTGEEVRAADGYSEWHYSHSPYRRQAGWNAYHRWLEAKGVRLEEVFEPGTEGSRAAAFGPYRSGCPAELHQSAWCAERAGEFIRERGGGGQGRGGRVVGVGGGRPWLLSVNFFDPHPPFDAPAAYRERYDAAGLAGRVRFRETDLVTQRRLEAAGLFFQGPARQPGAEERENLASYYGMIELLDAQVGRILAALEQTGQRERTLVIFMSDHGEMVGDHGLTLKGCRFYDGLVRVPLIVAWPGGDVRSGAVVDGLVELTDVAPTLAEIAGVRVESGAMDGRSLLPVLRGERAGTGREAVRCEYYDALNPRAPDEGPPHVPCYGTMRCDGRFKLTVYHGTGLGELYDLERDPDEHVNLWDVSDARGVRERLACECVDMSRRDGVTVPPRVGYF